MRRLITELILLFASYNVPLTKGKDITGHVLTDESWHYLDTFCVDGNSDEVILFNFEIEYIMRYFTHVQKILIYNDKEWPRLTNYNCSQKQGLLDMQYQINLTASNNTAECDRIDPKIPGVRRMYCKGSRELTATDDVEWHIATSNCNATISGVELWYTISITRKGGRSADYCHNKLRNKLIAVAITLGVILVLLYIAMIVLYFTKWRRNKPNQSDSAGRIAQTYSVHPDKQLPSSSNYGYVPDAATESTPANTHRDYEQTDDDADNHSLSAVVNANDSNSIPIRFPTDQPTSRGGDYSRESTTDSPIYVRYNNDNPGYTSVQRPRDDVRTRQLFYNPSFLSDMSEEPRHNTDNYQRYLWNKMRQSPQISNCTDNTYDEIENQHQHALALQTYGHYSDPYLKPPRSHAPATI